MPITYIGIGSNIDPEKNLPLGADLLRAEFPHITFSSVYRTAARDFEEQPEFLNAVARFDTDISAEEVLNRLDDVEISMEKGTPVPRFGPRIIDFDIELYGNKIIPNRPLWIAQQEAPREEWLAPLVIPHPRLHERRFVLEPLCELIDPASKHPALLKTWKKLLEDAKEQRCDKTSLTL